jgi:hypothetical protein
MKHELIKTENYLLIVSDKEITEQTGNDTIFNKNLNKITAGVYDDDDNQFKVLAHLPLNGTPYLEGVDVLPKIEDDDFLNTEIQVVGDNKTMSVSDFFKKCGKETYKYTEEDVKRAISFGQGMELWKEEEQINKFIQLLNQPELPITFDSHTQRFADKNNILKQWDEPRTITNSEGKTEWVGKYLFK